MVNVKIKNQPYKGKWNGKFYSSDKDEVRVYISNEEVHCKKSDVEEVPGYGKTFTWSKYNTDCADCGKPIVEGIDVRYRYFKGEKDIVHADCEHAEEDIERLKDKEQAEREAARAEYESKIHLGAGEGYGGTPYTVGDVLWHATEQKYVYIEEAKETYFDYDGMSFGVGAESGYYYQATAREATEDEWRPVHAKRMELKAERNRRKIYKAKLRELREYIIENGENPEGSHELNGKRYFDTQNIYGGGDWFEVTEDAIWYVKNNGADGDYWPANNVRTGGAGAIGTRIPYDKDIEEQLKFLESSS